jgi:rhodanese-related sulfurtransferase
MVVALVIGAREPWQPASAAWRAVDAQLTARYADLPTVDTDALADWLDNPNADTSGAAPLLLDARSEAEYAVSHLPGAIRVDPDAGVEAWRAAVAGARAGDPAGERPVVVYCSVGLRSARVAQGLRESGVGDVRNVRGSLFRWAAEGRALESADGRPATVVHPYDAVWGRLLPPALRAGERTGNGG